MNKFYLRTPEFTDADGTFARLFQAGQEPVLMDQKSMALADGSAVLQLSNKRVKLSCEAATSSHGQLRQELRKEADTPEHDSSIGEIAAAEVAAKCKGPQALEHLKKAGNWALGIAEKIGTTIAESAIKSALGL